MRKKPDRVYEVVRVTTIVEVCHVRMPTKKLAAQFAKSSDATRTEHTTGWKTTKRLGDAT